MTDGNKVKNNKLALQLSGANHATKAPPKADQLGLDRIRAAQLNPLGRERYLPRLA